MKKLLLLLLLSLLMMILTITIDGCFGENGNNSSINVSASPAINNSSEQMFGPFLFIGHHIQIGGENMEGRYPYTYIDFPGYDIIDKEGDTLIISRSDVNRDQMADLIAIIGDGVSLRGAIGQGADTTTIGVYDIPANIQVYATLNSMQNFNLTSISPDGTAHIQYQGKTIILKPGEKWENTTSVIETRNHDKVSYKTNVTINDTIVNFGYWKINKDYKGKRAD